MPTDLVRKFYGGDVPLIRGETCGKETSLVADISRSWEIWTSSEIHAQKTQCEGNSHGRKVVKRHFPDRKWNESKLFARESENPFFGGTNL